MNRTHYNMLYLTACGINETKPDMEVLGELDIEQLYRISKAHQIDALVGTSLKSAGISLPKAWTERISKAIRKNILFDVERAKLLAFMEQNGIWYLPLKGIVLKEYYPAVGMRQMSDNDILYDADFADKVQMYMEQQGYEATSIGKGTHDVYQKAPVYNFELHRILYGTMHPNHWDEYYKDVKKRLIPNEASSYGYHFTDEDFYIYIVSHAYKHYIGSGTGIRTLLDFYVYLKAKEHELDFSYIQKECAVLGIAEFEEKNRRLCKKVFKKQLEEMETFKQQLSNEEQDMLLYYLTSGVYGTMERGIENRIQKLQTENKKKAKLNYYLDRIFPDTNIMKKLYPFVEKHNYLLPLAYLCRFVRGFLDEKRRNYILKEIKIVKKIKK